MENKKLVLISRVRAMFSPVGGSWKSIGFLCMIGIAHAQAPPSVETVLYAFPSTAPHGGNPQAGLIADSQGNLYGTASSGGQGGAGEVFKVRADRRLAVLYSFTGGADGGNPYSRLTLDSAGNLYGAASGGGTAKAGVVFKIDVRGNETVLYNFTGGTDGGFPVGALTLDGAGNIYGTTASGGSGYGVVFRLDATGNLTVLHTFTGGTDGASPGGVVRDAAGNLYGSTFAGGNLSGCFGIGCGVIYKLDTAENETVLYSFTGGADGANPSNVISDAAGNLYGTTFAGGNLSACFGGGCGVAFKLDTAGNENVLYSFLGGTDGGFPGGLTLGGTNLYGVTGSGGNLSACGGSGCGVVFKMDLSGNETVLYSFAGGTDGSGPNAPLLLDSSGNVYGTTSGGGGVTGSGTVYKLDAQGHETLIYAFTGNTGGNGPYAGVTRDAAGSVYGTTFSGGTGNAGVVYKLDPGGQEKVLYEFTGGPDGANPVWELTRDRYGNLYGITPDGGLPVYFGGCGVVFKVGVSGKETVLHTFTGGADGCGSGKVVLDSAGNLYGTSQFGGLHSSSCSFFGCGVVFKLDPAGQETVLHSFTGADGNWAGDLTSDTAGNLYGTTLFGGPAEYAGGVVFKIDTLGNETTLHTFTGGTDGSNPRGVTLDSAGNLYGATSGGGSGNAGVLFKIDASGNETVLYNFTGGADGGTPLSGVVRDLAGNLYGVASAGGSYGQGVVYKLDTAGSETVLYSFSGGADGGFPFGKLILDPTGYLLGTAVNGGAHGTGVIFKVDLQ